MLKNNAKTLFVYSNLEFLDKEQLSSLGNRLQKGKIIGKAQ